MIVLVQPMYSKQELNADSTYVLYTQFCQAIHEIRKDWHFVVIFPDAKSGYKYQDDGFFNLPYVTRIPQRISPRKMSNAVSFDGIWYDSLMRQIGFDVVWCNLVEAAGSIAYSGQGVWQGTDLKVRPAVVAAHNYVIHESLQGNEGQRHILWAQMLGGYHADMNIHNSKYTEWMFEDNCKKYLSEDSLDYIRSKSQIIYLGPLDPQEFDHAQPDNDVPIIGYNHRLQGFKRYKETFSLLNDLYEEGLRFKVRYMNNTAEHISHIKKYPFVETRLCPTREDYLRELRQCDLNVTNSSYETFCISGIESMAFGQPLIGPDGITFAEITGKSENQYPYLFASDQEQRDHIRKLISDKQERQKWGKILRDHVLSHYDWKTWANQYVDLFERLNDIEYNIKEGALDLLRRGVEECHGKTTRELFNHVAGQKVDGKVPFANQSLPMAKLVRLVRKVGGTVKMVSGKQIVYKK